MGGLCDRCSQEKRKNLNIFEGYWVEIELLLGNGPRTRRCKAVGTDEEEEEEGRSRIERPKLRWIDVVLEDIKKLGVKNCWAAAKDREAG